MCGGGSGGGGGGGGDSVCSYHIFPYMFIIRIVYYSYFLIFVPLRSRFAILSCIFGGLGHLISSWRKSGFSGAGGFFLLWRFYYLNFSHSSSPNPDIFLGIIIYLGSACSGKLTLLRWLSLVSCIRR